MLVTIIYSLLIIHLSFKILNNYSKDILINKIKNEPLPNWFDKTLIPYFEAKKKIELNMIKQYPSVIIYLIIINYILKIFSYNHYYLYMNWKQLEKGIRDSINNDPKTYDGIIGVMSGGAFIANYYSKILNIPVYGYIKIERYKNDFISDFKNGWIDKGHHSNIKDVIIYQDIQNKNILLVDDSLGTGKTIKIAEDYLIKHKRVKTINHAIINCKLFQHQNTMCSKYLVSYAPWGRT